MSCRPTHKPRLLGQPLFRAERRSSGDYAGVSIFGWPSYFCLGYFLLSLDTQRAEAYLAPGVISSHNWTNNFEYIIFFSLNLSPIFHTATHGVARRIYRSVGTLFYTAYIFTGFSARQ